MVADVNGDGHPDVLTANTASSTLGVLLGDGRGGFVLQPPASPMGAGSNPLSLAAADVNGDGTLDVVLADQSNSTLAVLLGTGSGIFTRQPAVFSTGGGSHPTSVALLDVNGDGQRDALTTNSGSGALGVLLGDGTGGFTLQPLPLSTGPNTYPMAWQ